MECHALLDKLTALPGDTARSYNHLRAPENPIHVFRRFGNMLERTNYRRLRTRF